MVGAVVDVGTGADEVVGMEDDVEIGMAVCVLVEAVADGVGEGTSFNGEEMTGCSALDVPEEGGRLPDDGVELPPPVVPSVSGVPAGVMLLLPVVSVVAPVVVPDDDSVSSGCVLGVLVPCKGIVSGVKEGREPRSAGAPLLAVDAMAANLEHYRAASREETECERISPLSPPAAYMRLRGEGRSAPKGAEDESQCDAQCVAVPRPALDCRGCAASTTHVICGDGERAESSL